MSTHRVISTIQKNKNIPLNELTGNIMSRSTISRYLNGKHDISSQNFLLILKGLKVSLDEVLFIDHGFQASDELEWLKKISVAFEQGDLAQLKFLHASCQQKYQHTWDITFSHLQSFIDILMARMERRDIQIEDNALYQYLIRTETWTRYELVMFNNTLFYFPVAVVQLVLSKALLKLEMYSTFNPYVHEPFRLAVNAIIFFLKNKDRLSAHQYLSYVMQLQLSEQHVYERMVQKLMSVLHLALIGDKKYKTSLTECLATLKFLGLHHLHEMTQSLMLEFEQ